ncbi:exocyst complex component EXO70E2 [Mercurialis annua]|uniref:exocyst complex component EXO70E2 n=1 Tax=Mercurialis annua TaxID=3986 RepID=UPI00215F6DD2|nr:exocyst complex component EXO70E2 [Mercurialis annua]
MGDYGSVIPEYEREEDLIAAARHIARALGSKTNLTDDAKKILADLGSQLSNITIANEAKVNGISEDEERLNFVQEKIMSWETDQSMIWDSGPYEAKDYLYATDEARKLIEKLESSSLNKDGEENELLRKAHDILQIAMARLEEEFKHILVQNRQPFELEHVSFRSSEEDSADLSSVISLGDESVEESIHRDSLSRTSEDYIIDLVHPEVISELKTIANLMFTSNYSHECSQAYISVRRDALDECLFILEMEKLSIENVLKLEWGSLNSKIKRWVRAMKIFVRVYLASERWLTEQIFGELGGTVNLVCFAEASKASMMQLLNFGEAISIGPHKPEKLFPILDMYEVLKDLLPDIDSLYSDEAGFCVRNDCREVLRRLGDSVKAAFLEFENAIATSVSPNPFAGGGIHHLTRYVMNYLNSLTDYRESLRDLLKDRDGEDDISLSPDNSPPPEEDHANGSTCNPSPLCLHFRSAASILESNLEDKAKLYRDPSLQQVFLMNNIHYIAQKVKKSELRHIYGDDWIRKRNWKFQQHALNYERSTWSSVLSLLRDEGSSNSDSVSKTHLKERFRNFNLAFEEVYRTQTSWIIPDAQLREDLQISTSMKVIQAYRNFAGKQKNHISDKHIKYSADDLENFLLDLFQGSQRSLHNPHRR